MSDIGANIVQLVHSIKRVNHLFHIAQIGGRNNVIELFRQKKNRLQAELLTKYLSICKLQDDNHEYLIQIPELNIDACHIPKKLANEIIHSDEEIYEAN